MNIRRDKGVAHPAHGAFLLPFVTFANALSMEAVTARMDAPVIRRVAGKAHGAVEIVHRSSDCER